MVVVIALFPLEVEVFFGLGKFLEVEDLRESLFSVNQHYNYPSRAMKSTKKFEEMYQQSKNQERYGKIYKLKEEMIKNQEFHLERQLNLLKEKLVEPNLRQTE